MPDPREELKQRLQEPATPDMRQQLRERIADTEDGTTALGAFLTNLGKGTGNALMAIPSATGDLLAMGAAGVEGTAAGLSGGGFEYGRRYREQQQQFPANVIRSIPRPKTDEVVAGLRGLAAIVPGGETPQEAVASSMESAESLRAQHEAEHPIATMAGDFAGTVASLLIGKSPLRSTIRETEKRIMNPAAVAPKGKRALGDDIDSALKSNWARLGARGGFRAGESGLEAAYLEVLSESENNPILAAGLAGGSQMASSSLWGGLKSMAGGSPGKAAANFTAAALATGGLWQMVKSASPGGRDRILESVESGFTKTTYAIMLGVLGSAMGARGRGREVSEPLQNLIEGFTTVPRTGVLSLITEFADAPEDQQKAFESTIDKMLSDPDFTGETDLERRIVRRLRESQEP